MRNGARGGFTLVELIFAMALASLVMLGATYLMAPLARAQVRSARGQTAQLNAVAAQTLIERELRQATWLGSPSQPGVASDRLEGCQNGGETDGVAVLPLDSALPMRWFALCSQDQRLYYHTGDGCPPRYVCGVDPSATFGGGALASGETASFTRASTFTAVVDVELSFSSDGSTAAVLTAAAFSVAAGSDQ